MLPPDSGADQPVTPAVVAESVTEKSQDPMLARLRAEAKTPYRGLRRAFYLVFATSGLLGGFIFVLKLLAGEDLATNFSNLALQLGIVAGMVWFYRREERPKA